MTVTNAFKSRIAGLNLVLQPTKDTPSIRLTDWLSDADDSPVYIPQRQQNGVTRILVILPQSKDYPRLIEQIWQRFHVSGIDASSSSSSDRVHPNQPSTLNPDCDTIHPHPKNNSSFSPLVVEWQKKSYRITGIEVDSDDLHILQIPIFTPHRLSGNWGQELHALCCRWLAKRDARFAELFHQQTYRPMTLAMQPISRQQAYLKIGLLQTELFSPLLWGLSQDLGGELTLAASSCRLGNWVECLHRDNFFALFQVPPQPKLKLKFLSPTSFKQRQRIQPFPLPELVFGNLLRRWTVFAPPALQFPALEFQGLTGAYSLNTKILHLNSGVEIGATGWVRYEFPNPEQAKVATTLAHFARFAGVGRKTGMGMGHVCLG